MFKFPNIWGEACFDENGPRVPIKKYRFYSYFKPPRDTLHIAPYY